MIRPATFFDFFREMWQNLLFFLDFMATPIRSKGYSPVQPGMPVYGSSVFRYIPPFHQSTAGYADPVTLWSCQVLRLNGFSFHPVSFVYKKNRRNIFPTVFSVEATPRFELGNKGFADLCLTTWLCRHDDSQDAITCILACELARVAGFEPAHDGIRIHCLTTWRYPINGVGSGDRTHACRNHNPMS